MIALICEIFRVIEKQSSMFRTTKGLIIIPCIRLQMTNLKHALSDFLLL